MLILQRNGRVETRDRTIKLCCRTTDFSLAAGSEFHAVLIVIRVPTSCLQCFGGTLNYSWWMRECKPCKLWWTWYKEVKPRSLCRKSAGWNAIACHWLVCTCWKDCYKNGKNEDFERRHFQHHFWFWCCIRRCYSATYKSLRNYSWVFFLWEHSYLCSTQRL